MKNVLYFNNYTVQYWIGEEPNLPPILALEEKNKCDEINCIDIAQKSEICVELYLHKNASNYGMLGFDFIPETDAEGLEINIKYINENTQLYQSEINKYDKSIYNGLLAEYVPYIKKQIQDRVKTEFYKGTLNVSCATNSEVGSSPKIFCLITDIIIGLYKSLQRSDVINENEQMKEILAICGLSTEAKQ